MRRQPRAPHHAVAALVALIQRVLALLDTPSVGMGYSADFEPK
eukprot:CAMPEP_0174241770 /NCGR_PEP_ID=MMETSP0417-20130205/24765_1 /TAXON_ID=242541 /ORGANISM="Mayorella sp, Strain BSH-02190019" /LENGTH=42 /DNA_ID= /DNA_START= /DNA_END= /DNA_ORIENTATION=